MISIPKINIALQNVELTPPDLVRELSVELESILHFWRHKMPDENHGGFFGAMSHTGHINPLAAKGSVLHARILWTFSAAAMLKHDAVVTDAAKKAYTDFIDLFIDDEFGGVYWSVSYNGQPLETKKQVYAQAFAIYALGAYFELTAHEPALQLATQLYALIEEYSRDKIAEGYFEAFSRNWTEISDIRLSTKDANERKTMNTHLHVLEAYTQLYRVWPQKKLAQDIESLLNVFTTKIIDETTATQGLFFDENWQRKDAFISFGHDIEASWLLQEAAEVLGNKKWIATTKALAVRMASGALQGIDVDGGMWHEFDGVKNHWQLEKHWWPQAEAMVGFCNAWQNSGDIIFYQQMLQSWAFIKKYLLKKSLGEWCWGVYKDYAIMDNEDFAGMWKCPYHNGRACMELIKRLS